MATYSVLHANKNQLNYNTLCIGIIKSELKIKFTSHVSALPVCTECALVSHSMKGCRRSKT